MIDLKKLLPSNIRILKVADLIYNLQQFIVNKLKPEKLDSIKNSIQITNVTKDLLLQYAFQNGFNITCMDGYTDTMNYYKKQYTTMVARIISKTTVMAYNYEFYIFNLIGNSYPLLLNNGTLIPWVNDLIFPGYIDSFAHSLDSDMDEFGSLNGEAVRILDEEDENDILDFDVIDGTPTRHIVLSYYFNFIENINEFISTNTAIALFNDIFQIKKATETVHFEAILNLITVGVQANHSQTYTDDTLTITGESVSRYLKPSADFTQAFKIQFGSSSWTTVDNTITNVNTPIIKDYNNNLIVDGTILLSDFEIKVKTSNQLIFKTKINYNTKIFDFSEIAVKNAADEVLFYAKFPAIRFYERMLSSCYIYITVQ